jgi:tRNA(fMet)-specific endonuclease VapC
LKYLLDTNTCIQYLNGRSPGVKARLAACADTDIAVCSIVKGELYFGAAKSRDPATAKTKQDTFLSRFVSLPFDDAAADSYGEVRAVLAKAGQLIGPNDLLIASIALSQQLYLVTSNVGEFSRVPNLRIENWESA